MKEKTILLVGLMILLLLVGCGRGGAPGRRFARPEVPVPVIVEEVERRDLSEFLRITGKLEGITDIVMLSETSGQVLSLSKSLGDWIEKGEEIGKLDNEVVRIRLEQARAALNSANAAMETARMNYDSTSRLFENGSASQAEYQQALFAFQGAVAQRDGAAAALESAQKAFENSQLIAPVSGYISSLPLQVGEMIFPNSPIAGIVNHQQLLLKGGIGENHILNVRTGQPVIVSYRDKEYPARVRGVGVKALSGATYPIEIILDNVRGELLPGMVVNAMIQTNQYQDVFYTETGFIHSSYDDLYVYTVNDSARAERTYVKVGSRVNEFTIIEEGLEVGMKLVVEGMDSLEDGVVVNVRE
ncbi:MAG: efflux RND transporter periplasmic adaptor subunit [Candidatus Cloacimonetes bacterium]|nr:efflux RND transporter periplasmic adaptor subunit [Candidatus Cloacimonadota bacterium]